SEVIGKHESDLLADWLKQQLAATTIRMDLMSEADLRTESRQFLNLFRTAAESGNLSDIMSAAWTEPREFLAGVSRSRALQGYSPSEPAIFVFSMKQRLSPPLRHDLRNEPETLADEIWSATILLDKLGLFTTEVYQKSREEVIRRQQQELLEL